MNKPTLFPGRPHRHSRHSRRNWWGWAAALLLLVGLLTPQAVAAQEPEAEWAFSPMGVFADERVQLSMRLQMDTEAAGAASGVTLDYTGGGQLPPAEDASILLEAAGLLPPGGGEITGLVIERPCRVWSADESLAPAAITLGEEFARVWAQYGVGFAPCGATDDPAAADLLVFAPGQPPAEVDLMAVREQGSFLGLATPSEGMTGGANGGSTEDTEGPDATGSPGSSGASGGGDGPEPAQGGSGGDEASSSGLAMAVGAVAALIALALGRRLTGISPT